jgi:N-acetylglucosaminyldiphosphoundecaprenol N-acetyl-beta-D-mannosaminyltransferase
MLVNEDETGLETFLEPIEIICREPKPRRGRSRVEGSVIGRPARSSAVTRTNPEILPPVHPNGGVATGRAGHQPGKPRCVVRAAPSASSRALAMLGVVFDHVTTQQALDRIEDMVASRRPHYVVTANVDFVVQARRDVELQRILLAADLVLCDGTPLVWASRLLGNPLPERVAGADLVPRLVQQAAQKGYRVFFLGGAPGIAAAAARKLQTQFPSLHMAGYYSPPFRALLEMDREEIAGRIRATKPDLLFVSFGCPKAEKWIAMHYRFLGVPVVMGVGATIDFLAGHRKRAPRWMQRGGMEWIYRLLQEPRRLFRRYATDLWQFAPAMAAQWRRMPSRGGDRSAPAGEPNDSVRAVLQEPTWQRLEPPKRLDQRAVQRDRALWETIMNDSRHCLLEMAGVQFLDATAAGLLVRLHQRLRAADNFLVLLDPSAAVTRALRLMGLEEFFLSASDAVASRRLIEERREESESPVVVDGEARPLRWRGEITAANAGEIWTRMRDEIKSQCSWWKHWTVDLGEVRFIDSAGVALMKRLKQYAPRKGARIYFVESPDTVRTVLRRAGLEDLLLAKAERSSVMRARVSRSAARLLAWALSARTSIRRRPRSEGFAPGLNRRRYGRARPSWGGAA